MKVKDIEKLKIEVALNIKECFGLQCYITTLRCDTHNHVIGDYTLNFDDVILIKSEVGGMYLAFTEDYYFIRVNKVNYKGELFNKLRNKNVLMMCIARDLADLRNELEKERAESIKEL